jgi:hypothetical protein
VIEVRGRVKDEQLTQLTHSLTHCLTQLATLSLSQRQQQEALANVLLDDDDGRTPGSPAPSRQASTSLNLNAYYR